uniref:Uncharacterized protein n=1 Tax=Dendroctonus ponderosae TaxID=77166 RepID=A0AAR5PAZ8_DENPD
MNCRILFAVASVVVTSVSCYGYGQRRQSGKWTICGKIGLNVCVFPLVNDHLEAQANREFEDPRLDFQIGHFLPSQRLTDYGFNPEYSDVNENEGNNGKFEIPWEDEETGDVGDSWKTPSGGISKLMKFMISHIIVITAQSFTALTRQLFLGKTDHKP